MQQWFCVYRTLSTCFLLTVTAAQNILFCRCYHFFVCISLIICLHLHLSLSLLIPSPQLHLSYPPTAPAVTLQQLGMVTMVTHYHHHTGLLLSSPSLSSLPPLSEIRGSLPVFRSYPDLHNVKNDADAERGQAGWVSCLTEKWSADVRLSNWKKWKHGHWKGENVCVCVSACECLVCSQEFFLFSWLPSLTDILFFSTLLPLYGQKLPCVFHFSIIQSGTSYCDWYCIYKKRPKKAAERFPGGNTETLIVARKQFRPKGVTQISPWGQWFITRDT